MEHMEASSGFYVAMGMLDPLEPIRLCVVCVTKLAIVKWTMQVHSVFRITFMYTPGDHFRPTAPDGLSVEEYPLHI
jgi:hypothetical protein